MNALPSSTGYCYQPEEVLLKLRRWRVILHRFSGCLGDEVLQSVCMLLADQRFGADQLFLTANALREARREALLSEQANHAQALLSLAITLETAGADRARHTDWARAA